MKAYFEALRDDIQAIDWPTRILIIAMALCGTLAIATLANAEHGRSKQYDKLELKTMSPDQVRAYRRWRKVVGVPHIPWGCHIQAPLGTDGTDEHDIIMLCPLGIKIWGTNQ